MKSRKIHSISSLRQRREELKMEMKVTRQAISHSVKKTEYDARSFLVKNILIPIGAGGLAAILFNAKDDIQYQTDERPAWLIFLQKMMDVINDRFEPNAAANDPDPTPPQPETGQ